MAACDPTILCESAGDLLPPHRVLLTTRRRIDIARPIELIKHDFTDVEHVKGHQKKDQDTGQVTGDTGTARAFASDKAPAFQASMAYDTCLIRQILPDHRPLGQAWAGVCSEAAVAGDQIANCYKTTA